jgi:hypothetical protein
MLRSAYGFDWELDSEEPPAKSYRFHDGTATLTTLAQAIKVQKREKKMCRCNCRKLVACIWDSKSTCRAHPDPDLAIAGPKLPAVPARLTLLFCLHGHLRSERSP